MYDKLNKVLIVFLLLVLSVGIASATDADSNQSSDELAISIDLPENLTDSLEVEEVGESSHDDDDLVELSEIGEDVDKSVLSINNDDLDANPLSDEDDLEGIIEYIVRGTYNGGKTTYGYTVYCADYDLRTPTGDTPLNHTVTNILLNSFYDDNAGELLKILIYNYYDELGDVDFDIYKLSGNSIEVHKVNRNFVMNYLVWSLTDAPYRNINPEGDDIPGSGHVNPYSWLWNSYHFTYPEQLIQIAESHPEITEDSNYNYIIENNIDSRKVITDFLIDYTNRVLEDYDNGVRVRDYDIKLFDENTVEVYDFVGYLTDDYYQNLFGFKITKETINPNIKIYKQALNKTIFLDEEAEFVITVKNTGNVPLSDIFVKEDNPQALEYVTFKDSTGKWSHNGDTWTYDGVLYQKESAKFTVVFKGTEFGNLTNVAVVGAEGADDGSANDTTTVYHPSLKLTKVANDKNVLVGEKTSFTLTVTNTGDCDLTDVFVEDSLPEGLTYTGYKNGTGKWNKDGDKYYLTEALKAGKSATLIINVLTTAEGNFTNCATAGSNQTDNQTDNQTANDTVEVTEAPDEENNTSTEESSDVDISAESEASIESSDSDVVTKSDDKATGNPIFLLLIVLSLFGLTYLRKND